MSDYLLLAAGFILLIAGANFLVDGAVGTARHFGVSDLVIGLTIVAFGTSAPELVVNLTAAADPGSTDIALTNIIGSNTINILVILGVSALVCPIVARERSLRRFDIPLSLGAVVMVALLGLAFDSVLSRGDGVILLVVFALFLWIVLRHNPSEHPAEEDSGRKSKHLVLYLIMILGGLAALVFSGRMIVGSAVRIAEAWGVSQAVIGLTIIALGTSLPELATSVVAAAKRNSDIALGNVIGSNIFNVFFILGTSTLLRPLPAYTGMAVDLAAAGAGSLLVWIFVAADKKHAIRRWGGAVLLAVYAGYLYLLIRN